tara:strand:+ start:12079 stop:12345 length:267 start_codon:yes stop_codon:yes gene_type:complete
MNMKQYVDIRVRGHEEELIEFIQLLKTITTCGVYGSSRDITVSVDGDGSGYLDFRRLHEDGSHEELEPWPHKDFSDNEDGYLKLSIGE